MTNATQLLTLLDRTQTNRTTSTDLPFSVTGTANGDLMPWFVSIVVRHTTLQGRITNAELRLKLDINNRFVTSTPILIDEFAKNKYLIEWVASQNGNLSKVFVFQITNVATDIDKSNGMIVTISLTEQWVRLKESLSSIEHRFTTPYVSFIKRLDEFSNFQGSSGVQVLDNTSIDLPSTENLKQNYDPQAPTPILDLMQDVLDRLGDPNVSGGVFDDYYFDFEPAVSGTQKTRLLKTIAKVFGEDDSGIILDPKSLDTVDAVTEQTNITNNNSFKNHVILRCGARDGTLPMEHARFASKFLHAAGSKGNFTGRPIWSPDVQYLKGNQTKMTFNYGGIKIVRFFECVSSLATAGPNPAPYTDTSHWQEDFTNIPKYSRQGRYMTGDIVYQIVGSTVKYFICIADYLTPDVNTTAPSSADPNTNPTNWFGLNPTVPNRSTTGFVNYVALSPWTEEIDAWERNLAGRSNATVTGSADSFVGYACDWNVTRDTYDNTDVTNQYDTINIKMINMFGITNDSSIPTRELYHGYRVTIGGTPTGQLATDFNAGVTAGIYSGTANNRIAEYDASTSTAVWRFSRVPTTNDTIVDYGNAKIRKWNGSSWEVVWDINHQNGSGAYDSRDKPTPFHLVGNILRTRGATGIPASAIEWRYRTPSEFESFDFQNHRNNSFGVWMNFWFPFPKEDVNGTDKTVGYLYGGNAVTNDLRMCSLNTVNYTLDRKGKKIGWNNGLDSEDLGRITGIAFKLKVGFFNQPYHANNHLDPKEFDSLVANSTAVVGMSSIPMIFWAVDIFDRVWYTKFNLRANNQWENVIIPFGELAPQNLHIARWDELTDFLGYRITFNAFTIKEKEYSGIAFNWRFVKGWGMFWSGSYDPQWGFYRNDKDFFKSLYNVLYQLANDLTDDAILGDKLIYSSSIAIDELRFVKELIVNSDDVVVSDPRTTIENKLEEFDYENAKKIALGKKKRLSFFPQTWHVRTHGDVRMRVGERFKVVGNQVPNGEVEMVCAEVTHIINHEGYFMEVVGQRKFTKEG